MELIIQNQTSNIKPQISKVNYTDINVSKNNLKQGGNQIMEERNLRKVIVGKVVSDKMDKTVVVAVETSVKHKVYNKIVKRTYKLKAHDEANECKIGDTVKVMETRPLSKDKRWRVVEIMERAVIK